MIITKEVDEKSSGNSECWICRNFYDKNYNRIDVCKSCGKFHGYCYACLDFYSTYKTLPKEVFHIGEKIILAYYDDDRKYVKKMIEEKYK